MAYDESAPTLCLSCGTRWVYSFVDYSTGEPDAEMKARIEQVFPGLECLGVGSGVAAYGGGTIWRLF